MPGIEWGRFIQDGQEESALLEEPYPPAMQASQTWIGSWDGTSPSRGSNSPIVNNFEFDYELDFGTHSVANGETKYIQGVTFCSPQLNQPLTGSITLLSVQWMKRFATLTGCSIRAVTCFYVWKANDTLGTVYANAVPSLESSTTYTAMTMTSLQAGGVQFDPGDRLCVDLYLRVINSSGSNINSRWAYLRFGDVTYFSNFGVTGASRLILLQGIMQPMRHFGSL